MNFEFLHAQLLPRAQSLLAEWFPAGQIKGSEFLVGDLAGSKGESLSININTGKWQDFATGQKGGDLISLFAARENIGQGEAAKRLGGTTTRTKKPSVIPVPSTAGPCSCVHFKHGRPSRVWTYLTAAGLLAGYVARYDTPSGKEIIPWTHDGEQWRAGQWQAPRPLYGLELLQQRPNAPVAITEGEKAADAARQLLPDYVVVTWPGGAQAHSKTDWSPLRGRTILLWPDADNPGVKAMRSISQRLKDCPKIETVNVDGRPEGWDAADALAEGGWSLTINTTEPDEAPASQPQPTNHVAMWQAWGLDCGGRNGDPVPNLNNAVRILEHDTALRGLVWYDEFLNRLLTKDREWSDVDILELTLHMQRANGLSKLTKGIVGDAAETVAKRRRRNCAKDFLDSLEWDGESRIEHFFEDYFGAPVTAYTRAASRNFWISMAARIYKPGCKVDHMVVLEGKQGVGKSSALAAIGGAWYAEQHESATDPKAFAEILQGKLLIEISEMDAFSRAEVGRVKQVITNQADRFRAAYARNAEDHPRQCVMVGTTNKNDWARDETGARRFWPIECDGTIDVAGILAQREQLFAEAAALYRSGATWWEMPELETLAEQEKRRDADVWEDKIAEFVAIKTHVTMWDVFSECLKIETGKVTRNDQLRAGVCLRGLGWKKINKKTGNQVQKIWVRDDGSQVALVSSGLPLGNA